MIILHYIDAFNPILFHQEYFEILAKDVRAGDEVHLLMQKNDMGKVEIEGVKVHYLSFFHWMVWRNKRRFLKLMNEVNPDLLHIHSSWSLTVKRLLQWNEKYYKRPYILSTHKMFMPWHLKNNKLKRKLQMRLYQKKIIENADVVLVDTPQEMNIQHSVRIKLIPNALLTPDFSEDDMRKGFNELYAKIANSKPYLFMSDEERHQEANLLKEAVTPRKTEKEITQQPVLNDTLKKIALHAIQEGTFPMLEPLLPVETKIFIEEAPHFTYVTKKSTVPLRELKVLAHRSSLKSIGQEEYATEADYYIARMLINVIYEIQHNQISQRHLIELYEALHYHDYNEDTLNVMLQRMEIYNDAARLMQLMKDYYKLPEGFMPMMPLKDKTTDEIKTQLRLLQIQT